MRVNSIALSWFRGAANQVSLEPNGKSIVVYGSNGSGKSSFVDAIEYVLNTGKIGHLAHEYSGRRQERAVINTHKPENQTATLVFEFIDKSLVSVKIQRDGASQSFGGEAIGIDSWDYRRTVLRQDEVAQFIHDTKGGKYSALLPLLGLHPLEVAAENLRQLVKTLDETLGLKEIKAHLKNIESKRQSTFGAIGDSELVSKINELHTTYCPDKADAEDVKTRCEQLKSALETRLSMSSADHRRYFALKEASSRDLRGQIGAVRTANGQLAGALEPLVTEKLTVLQSTRVFVDKSVDQDTLSCPACGRPISVAELQKHVSAERERLSVLLEIFDRRKSSIGGLCHTVNALKSCVAKEDVQAWREGLIQTGLSPNLQYVNLLDTEVLRENCEEQDLRELEEKVLPITDAASVAIHILPPGGKQLFEDNQAVEVAYSVVTASESVATLQRAERLISFVNTLEQGIREEIRIRCTHVMDVISADIRAMWTTLHPGESIEGVNLYLPEDSDKAIDIGLKFHGVTQDSPRLTLSEGYRNSLGLCIFLAVAKRDADKDRPIILDDIVVSLDRNHRGMIAHLLEKDLSERQVVILTHDRDWYTELHHQLDDRRWSFKSLLPYETPQLGIRWSHKTTTFDDARFHLADRPDSAGNDARKIMDVELALVTERLQIRMPYVRGDKNDKRMAHDFLERLVADGKKCFQTKSGDGYTVHMTALTNLEDADRLIVSWANKASHTFDLVPSEASKLIEVCELALESFKCSSCGKAVWFANAEGSEWVQCQCGGIRWRYGKG